MRNLYNRPNLLIVGAQKCGTTWLHNALNYSDNFFGSNLKELNYWNTNRIRSVSEYLKHFQEADLNTKYIYETTPHYFRLPKNGVDVANRISYHLGDIPLILMLRNPVERYLSAYTHHMMQGRVPVVEVIDTKIDDYDMVTLGYYAEILEHFNKYFNNIKIYFYHDLQNGEIDFIKKVLNDFNVDVDFDLNKVVFRTNDKYKKSKKNNIDILPVLSESLIYELKQTYHEDIIKLETMLDVNLEIWK